MDAPTVTLGKHTATLVAPSPMAALAINRTREELEAADVSLYWSLCAAALYLCWPEDVTWPTRPRPRPWKIGARIEDYGAGVFNALCTRDGLPMDVLFTEGPKAFAWAVGHCLTAAEVEAASDFSEPRAEAG